jgi:hypothetical protein
MTLTPPQPRDDNDLDGWLCPSANAPDGDDQPGAVGQSIPWRDFALDGYALVLGGRIRRSLGARILDLVHRVQHTG